MKKLLILALVAIIAGAAFADTDPAFSGTFSTYFGYQLGVTPNDLVDGVTDSMKIDLNATIDEWNTLSVTVELADALYWDDSNKNKAVDAFSIKTPEYTVTFPSGGGTQKLASQTLGGGKELANRGDYLRMKAFTLTSDITGALGVDAPVSVKLKFGKFAFGKDHSVVSVAPLSTKGANGAGGTIDDIGIGLDLTILDMITLGTVFYPEDSFESDTAETGVTLKATDIAKMIDVAAYFVQSATDYTKKEDGKTDKDPNGRNLGISVAARPFDGLAIGVGFEYDMDGKHSDQKKDAKEGKGVAKLQADASFTMVENLGLGLSYSVTDFTSFASKSSIKFSATYDIMDSLSVYGGIGLGKLSGDLTVANDLSYDAGITTAIGALDIMLGVTNNMKFKAPKDDWKDTIFVKFSTAF